MFGAHAGSSPLTRGKPLPLGLLDERRGLIPAHAGKTMWWLGGSAHGAAHPRSRGENGPTSYAGNITVGSSPLTRGKQGTAILHAAAGGLIPAHAGKTSHGPQAFAPHRAHPRSRGENVLEEIGGNVEKGSSPLTRGKRSPDS